MVVLVAVRRIFRYHSIYQSHFRHSGWNKLEEPCRSFATEFAGTGLKVNDYSNKEYSKNLHGFNDALLERVC